MRRDFGHTHGMQHTETRRPVRERGSLPDLIGAVRRFGPHGVPYEVLSIVSADEVLIRVISTGEETTYRTADVLADPED
jgi:Family of unknown function (DUF5397)